MIKLYYTPGSPYARIVRIVLIEKGLQDRVECSVAQTRTPDSPYYAINPSGRVPYLVCGDGRAFEDSALICDWLDLLDAAPRFSLQDDSGWEVRRLEALARSMLDGLAVWVRENSRPAGERSPALIAHESGRARRLADVWEREIARPQMGGDLNLAQIVLACTLGFAARLPQYDWRTGHPALCAWFDAFAARPSFVATQAPAPAPASPGRT